MVSKTLMLSIPEPLWERLKKEKENFAYFSIQEIIISMLREKFYFKPAEKITEKEKRGRPEKFDIQKLLAAKKVLK